MYRATKLRAAVATTTLLGSIIALTGSAQAAVPGLVRVTSSISGTANYQSTSATCPLGLALMGAGYLVDGATGEVIVDDFVPSVGPTGSVFVGAYEADPDYTDNWTLHAYAICAFPLPGQVQVTAVSDSTSGNKSVLATCPFPTTPIGTGFQIEGAPGAVTVNILRPTATGVQASAYEEDVYDGSWTVRAYAICANPPAGLQHISAGNPIGGSPDSRSETAACAPGRVLTGLGFQVTGGLGRVVIDDFIPNGSASVAPTQLTVGTYDADEDFDGDWTLTALGICATA